MAINQSINSNIYVVEAKMPAVNGTTTVTLPIEFAQSYILAARFQNANSVYRTWNYGTVTDYGINVDLMDVTLTISNKSSWAVGKTIKILMCRDINSLF